MNRPINPLALILLAIAVYLPALTAGLIWDDILFVWDPAMSATSGLREIWTGAASPDYFPLTFTSFWLERHLLGESAFYSHTINVLLHGAAGMLLFRLLRKLQIPGALLIAAIFVVHPINVPSVAWITERKNTLSLVLYLASVGLFLDHLESPPARRQRYALSVLVFLLALLSKTSVVAMPVGLLAIVGWRQGRIGRTDILRVLPYAALSLGLGVVTIRLQAARALAGEVVRTDGALSRIGTAAHAIWFYLEKIVLPSGLSLVYPRWETGPLTAVSIVSIAALLGAGALLWKGRNLWGRAPGRIPILGGVFFVAHIFPVLGFFQMAYMRFSFVADHWLYLPAIGVFTTAVGGGAALVARWGRQREGAVVGLALVAGLGALTFQRSKEFHDDETVWRATVARFPDLWVARKNLGYALETSGANEEAEVHYRRALAILPGDPGVLTALGRVLSHMGKVDGAIDAFEQVLKMHPTWGDVHNNLGFGLYTKPERLDEAIEHFREAARLIPVDPQPPLNLAVALLKKGDREGAVASHRRALELGGKDPQSTIDIARILSSPDFPGRDLKEAVRVAELGCKMTGFSHLPSMVTLVVVLARSDRCDDAVAVAHKTAALPAAMGHQDLAAESLAEIEACRRRAGKPSIPP